MGSPRMPLLWQAESLKETQEGGRPSGGPRQARIHAAGHRPPHALPDRTLHRPGSEARNSVTAQSHPFSPRGGAKLGTHNQEPQILPRNLG